MFIVIIRHGETLQNLRGVFQGQSDSELHDVGIARFKGLGIMLKDQKWDAIYSSHYKRSLVSASLLAKEIGVEQFVSQDLGERDLGVLDGTSREIHLEADPMLLESLLTLEYSPRKGESGSAALSRFLRSIEGIAARHSGRVIVISHGGVVALFAHYVLDVPSKSSFLEHGNALIIEVSGTVIKLKGMNVPPELIVSNLPAN